MHDHDDIDFSFTDLPTRPGPCKAALAPEADPVEARLHREREVAPWIAEFTGLVGALCREVKHGSGKVKV